MLSDVSIYMDEFGNTHLHPEKQGSFSHFVYTAVVLKRENVQAANILRYKISKKFLQGHPIKSSALKNNDKGFNKRLGILAELKELDFLVFSLVIDKKKVKSKGLEYKKVFYKYFNKIFLREFATLYDSFEVFADSFGHPDFQRSLTDYVYDNAIQKDLFHQDRSYQLADDKEEEPLIQLADFISGCIGKIYCTSHSHHRSDELFELLHDRLFIDFFPYEKKYIEGSTPSAKTDSRIGFTAMKIANDFLDGPKRNLVSKEAVEVLRYLMLMYESFPDKMVETYDILKKVSAINPKYHEAAFRQDIQSLRDKGLLISSISGKSGYKLPNSEDDVIGFYNRYLNSIIPMLRRISIANNTLQKHTLNEVNLLTSDYGLEELRKLVNTIEDK